jgi:hydroxyacylglutathione hydrolase
VFLTRTGSHGACHRARIRATRWFENAPKRDNARNRRLVQIARREHDKAAAALRLFTRFLPAILLAIFTWRDLKNRHCAAMADENETKSKAGALIIPVTPLEQNCTLIWCEASKKAVVIDPGGDVPKILRAITQSNVKVEKIWLTHGHIDHVGGAAELRDTLKVPIEGPHIDDKYLLDNVVSSGARFGMTGVRDFAPDRWLNEGDQVSVGELTFDILHCPGHSPGSVVFYNKELHFAQVGDVLFNGSVGRTDLPGGSHETLIKSIVEKLLPLGDDVSFVCGHGAGSSIGQERLTNPFLTGEM